MKLPYGRSNFKDVITGGYIYIDKTAYIAQLEASGGFHILLRPRRFGKSLFLSTLWHYYDVQRKDEFGTLFGKLHIGQHPTPLKNSYQVLFMEFSGIETGSYEQVYQGFDARVASWLKAFMERYHYPPDAIQDVLARASPADKMQRCFGAVGDTKLCLLIDEYDHFANALLAEDQTLFQRVMGKGGFVRSFYEVIKSATLTGVVDRIFITGVTPLMLDSMTSGFNIARNLSLHKGFNAVMGFTREETVSLLQPLADGCQLAMDTLMGEVTRWYNGYRFHPQARETVYNPNMVLYFANEFNREQCSNPRQMLDENIASDYRKIMALFGIGDRDTNDQVLDELIDTGEVSAQQQRKFELDKGFNRDDFISLLAYMGFVTVSGETLVGEVFTIPNHAIRELYFQYFKVELERRNQLRIPDRPVRLAIETLALRDDLCPLAAELQAVLQLLSNRDAQGMNEKHIKMVLLALFYQLPIYFIQSEPEKNRRYPDIMLLERSPFVVNHQHLIELKYSKKGEGEKGWEAKRQEGIQQVQGYLQLPDIAVLPKLSAWLLLTDGEQLEVVRLVKPKQ